MFIAVIGTRNAGKSTIETFLTKNKGFVSVKLLDRSPSEDGLADGEVHPLYDTDPTGAGFGELYGSSAPPDVESSRYRVSFLTMASPISSCLPSPAPGQEQNQPLWFRSPAEMLAHATRNWRTNFVTTHLGTLEVLADFKTRPFVLVVSVDAPLLVRYRRGLNCLKHSLEDFIREHDGFYYGTESHAQGSKTNLQTITSERRHRVPFRSLNQLASVHVVNSFETLSDFYEHLSELNILDPERLRPGWDTYFMQLASLASQRSNCMKRRVGAILVRNKRVVSTGYNGTPRGLKNCNEGGCARCNTANETPDECLCLHAEENALLEAGRERVGDGSVLYCNTCPCLKCTIKIIQTGVREVVYNLSYKMDDSSAALFAEAGVLLRRHAIPE
ncbi:cytidine deaminase-like protein [Trametes meyenii]|nr:cytidine deaminase-like protein [Trametes meyenii]